MNKKEGFTLIELLVVVAIISVLSSMILASLNTARLKGNISKAQEEMHQMTLALELLNSDTGLNPDPDATKYPPGNCAYNDPSGNNEVSLDTPQAGLFAEDGNFPGWNGPYMKVPLDPWGTPYIFDEDFMCTDPIPVGCEGITKNVWHRAIVSGGPNKSGVNIYDSDNVVQILCTR